MSLGIAFEGCACRAAWQVGVMEWLVERGLCPEVVAGCSSGALMAGLVAVGGERDLRETWLEITTRHRPYDARAPLRGGWPGRMSHVLRAALATLAGDRRMADMVRPVAITVTMVGRRGLFRRVVTRQDPFRVDEVMLASCFIPGPYSRLPLLGGRPAFDGAWLQRVPIDTLAPLGARRSLALVSDPSGRLIGGALRQVELPWPSEVRVLAPEARLPIGAFDFDRERTLATMALGRASAERFARDHAAWLAA